MEKKLFHTSFEIVKAPDITHGRPNADFGQGFYLSDDEEFSKRWAKKRKDFTSYINKYVLDTTGLKIKTFHRDNDWFEYISANRAGKKDSLSDYDVISGPIANDTLYDTYGIITSGILSTEQALNILRIGSEYTQIVLKSQKAVDALKFEEAFTLQDDEIEKYQALVRDEERNFQEKFNEIVGKLDILE